MTVLEAFGEADVVPFVIRLVKTRMVRGAAPSGASGPPLACPPSPQITLAGAFAGTKLAFARSDLASASGLLAASAGDGFLPSAGAGGSRFAFQFGTPPVA